MVINVAPISESTLDNMFHEVELFVLESCHEIRMDSIMLDESESNIKLATTITTINKINDKIIELYDKAVEFIKLNCIKIKAIIANKFVEKNRNKRNLIDQEYIKAAIFTYSKNNPFNYYNIPSVESFSSIIDEVSKENNNAPYVYVQDYMDKLEIPKSEKDKILNLNISILVNRKFDTKYIGDCKKWKDSLIKNLNKIEDAYKIKNIANLYTAIIKAIISNMKVETRVLKIAMTIKFKNNNDSNVFEYEDYDE